MNAYAHAIYTHTNHRRMDRGCYTCMHVRAWMRVYICVCVCAYIHTQSEWFIPLWQSITMLLCMYLCTRVYGYARTRAQPEHAWSCICSCMYACTWMCTYVHKGRNLRYKKVIWGCRMVIIMFTYGCVYKHMHTHTQKNANARTFLYLNSAERYTTTQ